MILTSLLFYDEVTIVHIYNSPTVEVRLFVGVMLCLLYCSLNFMCVFFVFFVLFCFVFLRLRHDHNKIASCGMINVFVATCLSRQKYVCRDKSFVKLILVASLANDTRRPIHSSPCIAPTPFLRKGLYLQSFLELLL